MKDEGCSLLPRRGRMKDKKGRVRIMGKSKEEKIRRIYPNRLSPPFSLHTSYFILLTLGSGILMGLTTAPVGAWFLAWIALAPLWVLVVRSQKEKSLHPTPSLPQATSFI
jgi:hypothetical protein